MSSRFRSLREPAPLTNPSTPRPVVSPGDGGKSERDRPPGEDPAVEAGDDEGVGWGPDPGSAPPPERGGDAVGADVASWLEQRGGRLAERWLAELRSRGTGGNGETEALMAEFVGFFVDVLPAALGPYREQVEPLWVQGAELFGQVAAQRGLAAGEVIEEFQLVREAVIRLLYAEPPVAGATPRWLRDVLRLNRLIDRGVSQSSVGHMDVLFFSLFRGSGVPERLEEHILDEVREQLRALRREFDAVMRVLRG